MIARRQKRLFEAFRKKGSQLLQRGCPPLSFRCRAEKQLSALALLIPKPHSSPSGPLSLQAFMADPNSVHATGK